MDWEQEKTLLELDVANLKVRLKMAMDDVRRLESAMQRKRRAVLVTVRSNGEVNVYGRGVEVCEAYFPQGEYSGSAASLIEEYIDASLAEPYRGIHLPLHCKLTVNTNACPTLTRLYGSVVDQTVIAALEKSRRERERLFPSKDKTNAQKKKAHTRPASGERRARRLG